MSTLPSISPFDQQAIEQLRRELRLDPQHIRDLRNALLKRFKADEDALSEFTAPHRLALHSLSLFQRCDSSLDGATKLLMRTRAGMLIETVILRIATGRTTLCVSSQVGCAAACEFCATGKMGIARNLSYEEILDQVLQAGQLLATEDRRLRNIVFMGMGEPFHNEDNLYRAIEFLTSPEFFNISPTKILVSTVGVTDAMLRCVDRFPQVNLALSLHSVRQEVREQLIPLATKYSLDELHNTVTEINRRQPTTVMIEYLMLAGTNDSHDDARELAQWLRGLDVHVNLIPYNPIDDAPQLSGSDNVAIDAFSYTMREAGFKTTVRYSLGNDIAAACGQLVRRENREIAKGMDVVGIVSQD
ncbi:MAG: 23S rRNA (adenine(2503)-C(2))-methyltransferase RlmN [Planctomycetes bacterium]|nr:23S rRNA (adenine(2503)-C(2))-methyltransferase RlmN [Planctomycetota bacterium]